MGAASFTFLHAADLHIDSPLRGLVRYEGAPAERLRAATREAFANLVTEAVERRVAFLIVAGDVFDGDWRDYNSGLWFTSELRRLKDASIPVFLIRGNHDAESRVSKKLALPEGVQEFPSKRAKTIRLKAFGVALHGQSFAVPHVEENLVHGYPEPVEGMLNIGVLHTGLEGYEGHGRYAPCTAEDLRAKGYDYWALGHIHKREVISEAPWIVFPGNLQGRHARETGPKGATLVRVENGGIVGLEELHCDVARWAHLKIDLTGVESEDDAFRSVEEALLEASRDAGERLLAARVTLAGATSLNSAFRAHPDRIRSEVRARGLASVADLWVEKVRVDTIPVARERALDSEGVDALTSRIESATLTEEEAIVIAKSLSRLGDRLPPRVRERIQPKDTEVLIGAAASARLYLAALLRDDARSEGDA